MLASVMKAQPQEGCMKPNGPIFWVEIWFRETERSCLGSPQQHNRVTELHNIRYCDTGNRLSKVGNLHRRTRLKYSVEADCSKEMPTHRMRSAALRSSSITSKTSSGVITSSAVSSSSQAIEAAFSDRLIQDFLLLHGRPRVQSTRLCLYLMHVRKTQLDKQSTH